MASSGIRVQCQQLASLGIRAQREQLASLGIRARRQQARGCLAGLPQQASQYRLTHTHIHARARALGHTHAYCCASVGYGRTPHCLECCCCAAARRKHPHTGRTHPPTQAAPPPSPSGCTLPHPPRATRISPHHQATRAHPQRLYAPNSPHRPDAIPHSMGRTYPLAAAQAVGQLWCQC